ncbi:acyltransferase ChoActase/COT/CPT [Polychytrium aggregatum]|uniref:acyltransferase ChoActase/COT/CPT n=1 Tax=Polychytrium aggregatum TaxID=110093 RepID=UPI0022FDF97D|nr:acyltransferase ChoActase/COT/CPT [Polychytrium aggregatum]KAI9199507.1 acyltransferase ChoActase/COT/CPT [Polychytrium aggregatum]
MLFKPVHPATTRLVLALRPGSRTSALAARPASLVQRSLASRTSTMASSQLPTDVVPAMDSSRPLYRHQPSMPSLPVPPLRDTLKKYLASVQPLTTPAQLRQTTEHAAQLESGAGPLLQERLEKRAKQATTSWLYDWWNDLAYMSYRDPVVFYVSYFYVFKDPKPIAGALDPAQRAATLITAALEFKRLVVSAVPDKGKDGPLSSDQYGYMFNTCRIPQIPADKTAVYDPARHHHIVVIRKNKFFLLDTVHADGHQLSTHELQKQLSKIVDLAGSGKDEPLGLFTTQHRDTWSKIRDELLKSPSNRAALEKIESASLVVCLDDTSPITRAEASRACWHGDGQNRFFDKPLQLIVFENGKAGFAGEHSMMDGTPTNRMCDWILERLSRNEIAHGSESSTDSLRVPEQLAFDFQSIRPQFAEAQRHFDSHRDKHDLHVLYYPGYGKNFIKSAKFSPDAYVQMAIQLAYYKMHGQSCATYESAQTRKFKYGRTETCRTCSTLTVDFVKKMCAADVPASVVLGSLRAAVDGHVKYMVDAVEAKGVDRHLMGLKLCLEPGEPVPSFFDDPVYQQTRHWKLSTSQITSEYYDGYGWGEVVPDGYGIAYMIKDNSLHFNIACLNEMRADRMKHYLEEALDEMRVLTAPAPVIKARL